jgi:hypothetical protein
MMNRTLRHLFMSTSLGVAAVALLAPIGGAQAQDASSCMADVQALRAQETLGKGGQSVEAWANAAETACAAGDYGMASAYIADAERRMNLKEAQRDESGTERAERAALDGSRAGTAGNAFGGGALNADPNGDSVADDVGDFADDTGDEIDEAADDVGDEIEDVTDDIDDDVEDVADDVGDEIDDFADDFNDPDSPTPEMRTREAVRVPGAEPRTEARGVGTVSAGGQVN